MLEDAGLNTSKDVTLLQLGGSQERLAALIRGGIDAAPVDFAFEPKMKQLGFHLVPGRKTPFMNGPITVTVASLKANRSKWLRFVKAYLEATQYMTTNKEGSMEVLKRIIPADDKETLDHAYEQMRARATVDLIPPEAAVENLVKMMTYVDKRAATVDRSKLADYSILQRIGAKQSRDEKMNWSGGIMECLSDRLRTLQYSITPVLQFLTYERNSFHRHHPARRPAESLGPGDENRGDAWRRGANGSHRLRIDGVFRLDHDQEIRPRAQGKSLGLAARGSQTFSSHPAAQSRRPARLGRHGKTAPRSDEASGRARRLLWHNADPDFQLLERLSKR